MGVRTGRRASSQATEKDRIDSDQGLRHLATHRLPARAGGVVVRQGTRRREQAHVAWLGRIEHRPQFRDQGRLMGFQGITQHGKFAWSGFDQAVEEVINLGGIDGEKGKAGMKFLA